MYKIILCVLALLGMTSARMAFQFSSGIENVIRTVDETFSCEEKQYGYYADVQNGCKIFHVCFPILDADGEFAYMDHFSFFCGNGTVFNQESLTCTLAEDALPCDEAPSLVDTVNAAFGQIPEGGTFRQESPDQPSDGFGGFETAEATTLSDTEY